MNSEKWLVPCTRQVAVGAGNDSTTYNPPLKALYVGTTGNVTILTSGDSAAVAYSSVPAGFVFDWLLITKVMATGTTASNMTGSR